MRISGYYLIIRTFGGVLYGATFQLKNKICHSENRYTYSISRLHYFNAREIVFDIVLDRDISQYCRHLREETFREISLKASTSNSCFLYGMRTSLTRNIQQLLKDFEIKNLAPNKKRHPLTDIFQ